MLTEQSIFSTNPMPYRLTGINPNTAVKITVSQYDYSGDEAGRQLVTKRYADVNGIVEFDISPMVQKLRSLDDAYLYRRTIIKATKGVYNTLISSYDILDIIWGGIDVGKFYERYLYAGDPSVYPLTKARKFTFYRGLPFTLANRNIEDKVLFRPDGTFNMIVNSEQLYNFEATGVALDYGHYIIAPANSFNSVCNWNDFTSWNDTNLWKETGCLNSEIFYPLFLEVKEKPNNECLASRRVFYLRWFNGLGGYSYGMFNTVNRQNELTDELFSQRDVLHNNPQKTPASYPYGFREGDLMQLYRDTRTHYAIGNSTIPSENIDDLMDLERSIDVAFWDVNQGSWMQCYISGLNAYETRQNLHEVTFDLHTDINYNQTKL
jgi:hypothetical protein